MIYHNPVDCILFGLREACLLNVIAVLYQIYVLMFNVHVAYYEQLGSGF